MTCGSPKHLKEALAKIHVHESEKPQTPKKVEAAAATEDDGEREKIIAE